MKAVTYFVNIMSLSIGKGDDVTVQRVRSMDLTSPPSKIKTKGASISLSPNPVERSVEVFGHPSRTGLNRRKTTPDKPTMVPSNSRSSYLQAASNSLPSMTTLLDLILPMTPFGGAQKSPQATTESKADMSNTIGSGSYSGSTGYKHRSSFKTQMVEFSGLSRPTKNVVVDDKPRKFSKFSEDRREDLAKADEKQESSTDSSKEMTSNKFGISADTRQARPVQFHKRGSQKARLSPGETSVDIMDHITPRGGTDRRMSSRSINYFKRRLSQKEIDSVVTLLTMEPYNRDALGRRLSMPVRSRKMTQTQDRENRERSKQSVMSRSYRPSLMGSAGNVDHHPNDSQGSTRLNFVLKNRDWVRSVDARQKEIGDCGHMFRIIFIVSGVLAVAFGFAFLARFIFEKFFVLEQMAGMPKQTSIYTRLCESLLQQKVGVIYAFDEPSLAYSFMATLQIQHRNGSLRRVCDGVIVDKHHVITAAQCVTDEDSRDQSSDFVDVNITVFQGTSSDASGTEMPPISSEVVYVHSSFASLRFESVDMAVVRVGTKTPFNFSGQLRPACLARDNETLPEDRCIIIVDKMAGSGYQISTFQNTTQCLKHYLKQSVCKVRPKEKNPSRLYRHAMEHYVCSLSQDIDGDSKITGGAVVCPAKVGTDVLERKILQVKLFGLVTSNESRCNGYKANAVNYFLSIGSARNWLEYAALPAIKDETSGLKTLREARMRNCLQNVTMFRPQFLGNLTSDDILWTSIVSLQNRSPSHQIPDQATTQAVTIDTEMTATNSTFSDVTDNQTEVSQSREEDEDDLVEPEEFTSDPDLNSTVPPGEVTVVDQLLCRTFLQWLSCEESSPHPHKCDVDVIPRYLRDNKVIPFFHNIRCHVVNCHNSAGSVGGWHSWTETAVWLPLLTALSVLCLRGGS